MLRPGSDSTLHVLFLKKKKKRPSLINTVLVSYRKRAAINVRTDTTTIRTLYTVHCPQHANIDVLWWFYLKVGKTLAYTSVRFLNGKDELVARGSHTK